jgi:hypothetical protein
LVGSSVVVRFIYFIFVRIESLQQRWLSSSTDVDARVFALSKKSWMNENMFYRH